MWIQNKHDAKFFATIMSKGKYQIWMQISIDKEKNSLKNIANILDDIELSNIQ